MIKYKVPSGHTLEIESANMHKIFMRFYKLANEQFGILETGNPDDYLGFEYCLDTVTKEFGPFALVSLVDVPSKDESIS